MLIINVYVPDNETSKHVNEILTEFNEGAKLL